MGKVQIFDVILTLKHQLQSSNNRSTFKMKKPHIVLTACTLSQHKLIIRQSLQLNEQT